MNLEDEYIKKISNENAFLQAAAHGLSDRLTEAESILTMAMNFIVSIDYDSAIEAMQGVGVARTIKDFLSDEVNTQ